MGLSAVTALAILIVESWVRSVQIGIEASGLFFGMAVGFALSVYAFHNWYLWVKGVPAGRCQTCGQLVYQRKGEQSRAGAKKENAV